MTEDAVKGTITRRSLLQSAAFGAAASVDARLFGAGMAAPAYPSHQIDWVVPFAPGGATGRLSELVCPRLTERLGQPVVTQNKPGAGGNVATQAVISAAPDGHTVLVTSTANAINATFEPSLPFDVSRDLVHVAGLARMPLLLLVSSELPVKTLAEFLAYARSHPGKLSVGSAGPGTAQHLSAELFRAMADITWTHVHYRGSGPGVVDLSSGHVHAAFDNIASAQELLKTGRIRALAVTTRERIELMPDLPPIWDALPGFETLGIYGTAVPRGTPPDIIDILNHAINAVVTDATARDCFRDIGAIPITANVRDYGGLFAAEIARWRQTILLAGLKKRT